MTLSHGPRPLDDEALLGAFLAGELSAEEEASLLLRLEREPALQDTLDALAAATALDLSSPQEASADAGAPLVGGWSALGLRSLAHGDDGDGSDGGDDAALLTQRVLLAVAPAEAASAPLEQAALWTNLVVDGVADGDVVARLRALVERAIDQREPGATESGVDGDVAGVVIAGLAVAEATGALLGSASSKALVDDATADAQRAAIDAAVVRTERARGLACAAVDGELSVADAHELLALVDRGDDEAARALAVVAAARPIGEALARLADTPTLGALAARAGAAAVQVVEAQGAGAEARAHAAARATSTATATLSWWEALVGWARRLLVPAGLVAAAVAAIVVVTPPSRTDSTGSTHASSGATGASDAAGNATALAALQQQFVEVVAPRLLSSDTTAALMADDAPVLADNTAEVQALDATAKTMVFETPESHITVIWVADLGDDSSEGQGT